jgi:hypothetical protein
MPTPWVPNGYGAGADNSVVGGGGGYMAYPQPPSGENASFNPPENNVQEAAIEFTSTAAMLVHFIISNPGRSA